MKSSVVKSDYLRGLKDGFPISLGYIPVSMACAIAASKAGISFFISKLMSTIVFSGAGQATAVNLFQGGETQILMYALTLIIMNCRYILLSVSLSQRLDSSMSSLERAVVGFLNTDETFALAIRQKGDITASYFIGLGTLPVIGYFIGNVIGSFATNFFPESISSAFGIMIFAMFIALIIPSAKESKQVLYIVLIALAMSVILECIPFITQHLTAGWIIMICGISTAIFGAIVFPVKEEESTNG